MLNAQATLQRQIDAQQDYDALVYGLRALDWSQGARFDYGVGPALAAQTDRARQVAARLLGRDELDQARSRAGIDAYWMKQAKQRAADELKAAKEARKAQYGGGVKQLRLALAQPALRCDACLPGEGHNEELAVAA